MYLLIPGIIFLVSLIGIGLLIGRKFVYLKKLSPEAIGNPPGTMKTFWSGFIPELASWYRGINWIEYRVRFMTEFDKLLRRLRLVFLKIEGITHGMSQRLRHSTKKHEELLTKQEEAKMEERELLAAQPAVTTTDPKEEEQHIIMEIAKNPKDSLLYLKLGDVYLKMHDVENAVLSFKTVLDLDPENWYAKKMLAGLAQR